MTEQILEQVRQSPQVSTLMDLRCRLQEAIDGKVQGLLELRRGVNEKRKEMDEAQARAREAVGLGKDPSAFLREIQELRADIESIEELLPGLDEDVAEIDRRRLSRVEADLRNAIQNAIVSSSLFSGVREDLLHSIEKLDQTVSSWMAAVEVAYQKFDLEPMRGAGVWPLRNQQTKLHDFLRGFQPEHM